MRLSVIDLLARATGVYWGEGTGPDDFVARVAVEDAGDGTLIVGYEAWSRQHGLQHAEAVRLGPSDGGAILVATSDGSGDTLLFREAELGVFGSTGPDPVGLVIEVGHESLTLSWWWPDDGGGLREQSRAQVRAMRPIVAAPPLPGQSEDAETPGDTETPGADPAVPWPGVVVLAGPGTGVIAQRLAQRLSRTAVVRTDLFDKAVLGTETGAPDPALRQAIAVAVVRGYAAAGHPVIVHGAADRPSHQRLFDALVAAGLAPVRLVDVTDGEDYGEVARRLIET